MLNWKEVHLLLSELPLKDSYVQKVTEHDFHSFTLSLFSRDEKAWLLYVEIGTPDSHFCRTSTIRRKSEKTQRFCQYLKSRIIGAKICEVVPFPFGRAFILTLQKDGRTFNMLLRFYSGPGANIIVMDEGNRIDELLFRRPARNEVKGEELDIEFRSEEGERSFSVRPWQGESFNEFIDRTYSAKARDESRELFTERIERRRDRELQDIERRIASFGKRLEMTEDYETEKKKADLLSANLHIVSKGMDRIELDDWETGNRISIGLDASKSPRENLLGLYDRYQKDRKTHELTLKELEGERRLLEERKAFYEELLSPDTELSRLRKESETVPSGKTRQSRYNGLEIASRGMTLIVGRNSRENDRILRHDARGNDIWMHTRDYSGGYVVIKTQKGKSVPLEVLLDAASLAIHYSKAKKEGHADLYYTQVKYLRRAKNGKEGLVLPTQERNLHVELDEERVRRLIADREENQ